MSVNDLIQQAKKEIVSELSKEGQKIVNDAYWSKAAMDRSGNMHDAYGYAVYFRGKLEKKGYAAGGKMSSDIHKGWKKHGISANTGRGYLDEFFNDYKPNPNGFELVCVNAVYYAEILEDGAQGRPKVPISKKYKIISQVSSKIDDLAKRFGGKVKIINSKS